MSKQPKHSDKDVSLQMFFSNTIICQVPRGWKLSCCFCSHNGWGRYHGGFSSVERVSPYVTSRARVATSSSRVKGSNSGRRESRVFSTWCLKGVFDGRLKALKSLFNLIKSACAACAEKPFILSSSSLFALAHRAGIITWWLPASSSLQMSVTTLRNHWSVYPEFSVKKSSAQN